jgi:hypothetical protein
MATFAASLISGGVQEISAIALIGGYCTNIFEQNSQIIAKIEMSSEAIVSNNQRSLPTYIKNIVRATCVKTSFVH